MQSTHTHNTIILNRPYLAHLEVCSATGRRVSPLLSCGEEEMPMGGMMVFHPGSLVCEMSSQERCCFLLLSADVARQRPEEEQPAASLAELAAQKTQQKEDVREERKNSLEVRDSRLQDASPGEKDDQDEAESNEIKDAEDAQGEVALDNHVDKDLGEDEQQQRGEGEEQRRGPRNSLELEEEGEQPSRQGQGQSKEEAAEERVEQEDDGEDAPGEEDPTEAERLLDLAEEDGEAEEMQEDDGMYLG